MGGRLPEAGKIKAVCAAGETITLSKAITINSSTLSQYNNKTITGSAPADCTDPFYSNSEGAVIIDGVTVNLTLKDFQIPLDQEGTGRKCGIGLCNGAVLNLTLEASIFMAVRSLQVPGALRLDLLLNPVRSRSSLAIIQRIPESP